MTPLYLYTIFDNGQPRYTGIKIKSKITYYDLYRTGAGKPLKTILNRIHIIREIILRANAAGHPIITSNFRNYLIAFNLPIDLREYNIYDYNYPLLPTGTTIESDERLVKSVLEHMSKRIPHAYQKIFANASIVYQDLQDNGLYLNYERVYPIWEQTTYSGRSKCLNFNIQGFHENEHIKPTISTDENILIHFDWICADIRVAGLLSEDTTLNDTFIDSDPYTYLASRINANKKDIAITRDDSKLLMLKTINSMDSSNEPIEDTYPKLNKWIANCRHNIKAGGTLHTILGKPFNIKRARNNLAVLNGAMQGSVAHAMQLVIRRVWERLRYSIIAEIHDSLIMSSRPDSNEIRSIINIVAGIMLYPFKDILQYNPIFPLKVSIGKRWRTWQPFEEYRSNGIIKIKTDTAKSPKSKNPIQVEG